MDKKNRECFTNAELEVICKTLADTNTGLTGSEIGYYLQMIGVEDIDSENTKWKRLYNALANRQNIDKKGNIVLAFTSKSLQPTRFIHKPELFKETIETMNTVLVFKGLEFGEDGKYHTTDRVSTLSEAKSRASRLKKDLLGRNLHPELLKFCKEELLTDNYFHAILEATKSIASNIRKRTGLTSDGAALIDETFSGETPLLKINDYINVTEKSEQKGFINLAKGLFGTFRNPTAHAPKIEWSLIEEDALDLFTLASYVLRRIDKSK